MCFLSWHSIWQNREHYGSGLGLLRLSYRLASHLPHERRHLAPETCLSQHEQGLRRHVGTSAENSLGNLLTTSTGLPRSTDSKPVLPRNGSFLCILCLPCTGTCETETTARTEAGFGYIGPEDLNPRLMRGYSKVQASLGLGFRG